MVLKRIWQHLNLRRRVQIWFLLILMICTSFAEVLSIGAVLPFLGVLTSPDIVFNKVELLPFINKLDIKSSDQLLLPLTLVFIFATLLAGFMRLVLVWAQYSLSSAIGADLSLDMYRRTLYQPYAVHVARNSSSLITAISSKADSFIGSLLAILVIISSTFLMLMILMTLLLIDSLIAITAFLGFGIIYATVIKTTKNRLIRDSQTISLQSNRVMQVLQEGFGGIRDVLIDGTQKTYCDIYHAADHSLRRAQANVRIIGGSPRYLIEALGMMLIAILAYIMALGSEGISAAIPVLGALALGAQRLLPLLQQAYSNLTSIRGSKAVLKDVLDILDQPIMDYSNGLSVSPIHFEKDIRFNNVFFRYADQAPWILNGIDFDIKKGSRIGFIGKTGCGKSTLIDLVMGLLNPTSGSLQIDGVTLTEKNKRSWQVRLAHVPQTIFLTDSTIAENIAFGQPKSNINMLLVRLAAQQAQIAETIESWQDKYETVIGERGVRLSGGQRQRIGIARALYKQSDVIVFDEATSALDEKTENAVMETINSLGNNITILIIAHRLSTLKNCSRIVELDQGIIKRDGSFEGVICGDR